MTSAQLKEISKQVASNGKTGDQELTLWITHEGFEWIETNADPATEDEEGFQELKETIVGEQGNMTLSEATEYLQNIDEDKEIEHEKLVELFRAIYDREPDQEDINQGLCSLCYAGIE